MENASKALIIAGAIILSILIIGIGMFIFSQAQNAIGDTGLDTEKAQQFNSKFTSYEGTISGTKAQALCEVVRAHNLKNIDDTTQQVRVLTTEIEAKGDNDIEKDVTDTATEVKKTLKSGYTYNVTFTYDKSSGYIYQISIIRKQNK